MEQISALSPVSLSHGAVSILSGQTWRGGGGSRQYGLRCVVGFMGGAIF